MIEYKTLEGVDFTELYNGFSKAFADYFVSFDMGLEQFASKMLKRKSYHPEISVGAYVAGQMVGFVFNGLRDFKGLKTAYDCGTGIMPEHRSKGIGNEILKVTEEILLKKGVQQYLLEVIQENEPAIKLYKKQGFEITRELHCYNSVKTNFTEMNEENLELADVKEINFNPDFFEFQPSWQNTPESVMEVPDKFSCIVCKDADNIIGYGIIEAETGDIPIIAVDPVFRRKGVGKRILNKLADISKSENIRAINIESTAVSVNQFLRSSGFTQSVDQFEMIKKLS